jgi:hypothetical protein
VKLPCTAQALLTVNPARIPLDIDCGETGSRCPNGEKYRKNRSGADLSEVHDLREYRDGDDMRMIHWKLSEKLVSPIVRDPSEPSKFYLLLLLDAGLYIGEKKLDSREVSAAVELFIAISERLVSLGVSHYVGITSDRLCYLPVTDRLSFCEMRSRLLCMVLPKQAGTAMKHFSVSDRRREFSKLLFVCSDSFDGEAERFCGEMSVTGICVSAEGESSAIVENNSEMIKISEKSVYGQTHRITI